MTKTNKSNFLKSTFDVSLLYIVSRIIGAIFAVLVVFNLGPEIITSKNTGGTILGLTMAVTPLLLGLCYFLLFLTDFGAMKFIGTLIRPVVRFFFNIPGRAAIDLLSSWVGSGQVGVIVTSRQYDSGFYTGREAAVIAANFYEC